MVEYDDTFRFTVEVACAPLPPSFFFKGSQKKCSNFWFHTNNKEPCACGPQQTLVFQM